MEYEFSKISLSLTDNDEARRNTTGAFTGNDAMYTPIHLSLLAAI